MLKQIKWFLGAAEMHCVRSKGILSADNGIKLYPGCSHDLIYCSPGSLCCRMDHDFEDIEIKENAIELFEAALKRKIKKRMTVTGAMTDPYIPLECGLKTSEEPFS